MWRVRRACRRIAGLCAAGLLASVMAASGAAATVTHPTSVDVDTAQVTAGRAAYANACAACHGAGLSGGGAPALQGAAFAARWLSSPGQTKALSAKLQTMPKGAPGSLPAKTYADIKAYILSANHYAPSRWAATAQSAQASTPLPAPPSSVTAPSTAAPSEAELTAPADADWPMYNRTYAGDRFSPLTQIDAANAGKLQVACILQMGVPGAFQTGLVVYKGVGYVTTAYSTVAFNAATCDKIWTHTYTPSGPEGLPNNRGVALADGAVFRGTSDGHLIAIDAANGKLLWDVHVGDSALGVYIPAAPIVFHGLVIVGLAGGDFGVPGHIYAFDARTGRLVWTFDTVPTGAAPGAETWKAGAAHGGGDTWSSFAADIKDGLVLAPVGNPAPDFIPDARPGDNLYTNSAVALDAASGKLAWYEQQRPADYHDWDTAAPPMLFEQDGRRFLAQGSKDGYLYLYDRDSRALIAKTEVTTIENADAPLALGKPVQVCPGYTGGVEWNGPAYSPLAKAMFVGSVDWCGNYTRGKVEPPKPDAVMFGGDFAYTGEQRGWIKALDAASGRELWSYHAAKPVIGGITPTAGGVVLAGVSDGDFLVFDAKDGRILYSFQTGGAIAGGVSSYAVADRQYVAVASGSRGVIAFGAPGSPTVVVFALPK